MPKKKSLLDRSIRIKLSGKPHPKKKIEMSKIMDDARIIDIDLRPIVWDPLPKMTKAIEKEGWAGGIKHIKNALKKSKM